jgi:hypothetical protein
MVSRAIGSREIARNSRTFATMISCPISWSCWLIQIGCVPAYIAIALEAGQ